MIANKTQLRATSLSPNLGPSKDCLSWERACSRMVPILRASSLPQETLTRIGSPIAILKHLTFLLFIIVLAACSHQPTILATATEPAQLLPLHVVADLPLMTAYPALSPPELHQHQLANGATLTLIPSTRAPYVQVQLIVDAGRLLFGANADVLAEILRLTGDAETPAAWQQRWRELAATLTVRSGPHRLIFSAEVLPNNAKQLLNTLRDMWQNPNLDSANVLAQAQRNLRVQQHEQDLLGGDYGRLWQQLAYGPAHPYGSNAVNRVALQAVTLSSLRQSWQQTATEKQQWLIAGAVPNEQIASWRTTIAHVPGTTPVARWRGQQAVVASASTRMTIHLLHAESAVQVNVMLGFALPLQDWSARWTCAAIADLLGMSFSGRLFADLRERRGLSYDVGGHCSVAPLASELLLSGSTRPEHGAAFIHGLLAHLRLLSVHAATEPEMQRLRGALRGQTRVQLETARQRSRQFNAVELLGGDWRTLVEQDEFWQQLPAQALPDFARQWLQGEPVIVVRGDAGELEQQLRLVFPDAQYIRHDEVP